MVLVLERSTALSGRGGSVEKEKDFLEGGGSSASVSNPTFSASVAVAVVVSVSALRSKKAVPSGKPFFMMLLLALQLLLV